MTGEKTLLQTEVVTLPKNEIRDMIQDAVATGLLDCGVRCPIPEDARRETPHMFGVYKDLGDGEISKGLEQVRRNHEFTARSRQLSATFTSKIVIFIMTVVIAGTAMAIWAGVKSYLIMLSAGVA